MIRAMSVDNHLLLVYGFKPVLLANNDPNAQIFNNCNRDIVDDLYQVAPQLIAAMRTSG